MQCITVGLGERSYTLHVGSGLLARIEQYLAPLAPTALLVACDSNLVSLYAQDCASRLLPLARVGMCVLEPGEAGKDLRAVQQVLDALLDLGADRRSVVVAVGGGVVGDIAGFAAAIYMRGIRFVQVPTTLLAQVDSSVGGKTGVNHPRGKNLIGAFHQPALVLADTDALRTLPPRELAAGLAEVIKHGLLADADYLAQVEQSLPQLLACDPQALTATVVRSCQIKVGMVERDERESGERALLNLGHTFGHAIEALTGYARWLHGEAVGCGLCLAADLSRRLGYLTVADVTRVEAVVKAAGLPARIGGLSAAAAVASMRGDKKAAAGQIRFIVLQQLGKALQRPVDDQVLGQTLAAGGFT